MIFNLKALSIIIATSLPVASISKKEHYLTKKPEAENSIIFKTKQAEEDYFKAYNKTLQWWNTPFEEVNIPTSFGTAHVIMSGPKKGKPLILLHGLNASSTMWYPNAASFSKNYRVYAIDFIMEPGKSIAKKELETSDDIIKWYDEIFNYFKLDKIDLVGSSRGGWLAVNYALHSNRIEKIVLLSPAQTFTFIKAEKKLFTSIAFVAAPKKGKLIKAMESFSSNVYNIKPEFREQFYLATEGTKKNTSIFQMTPFSEKDLKSLSIPVLLLIGDNDIINSQSSIEKAQKYIPNLKAETVANAGHFLSFDQPDIINKKTLDFLSN